MSHNWETGVMNKKASWHGMETLHTEGVLYPDEALKLAELDWTVEKYPVIFNGNHVENKFFTVRESDMSPLGIVGNTYQILQNHEAFSFLGDLVESDIEIESAMSLRKGKQVVVLAKRPEHVLIAGEPITPYLAISNSFDGSSQINVLATDVRIQCQNTLNLALNGVKQLHKVKHTRSATLRLQEARDSLELSFNYTAAMKEFGENLAMDKFSPRDFTKLTHKLFPIGDEESKRSVTIAENKRSDLAAIYYHEENLNNIRGTAWGAFQSVVQLADWGKNYKTPTRRVEHILDGHDITRQAAEILA